MSNSSSFGRRHPSTNSPPHKRVKIAHEELEHTPLNLSSHFLNLGRHQPSTTISRRQPMIPNNATMTSPPLITNTYIPHYSLEPISHKIKKLQSDLSSAATGQCWGPGKQKVLDCKHDVDALATMVKKLDVDGIARKKSLDMLVETRIDKLFESSVSKAKALVNETGVFLIEDALISDSSRRNIKAEIKKSLDKEVDVLLDFEVKFEECFNEALADAVSRLVAERSRCEFLNQLKGV